MRGFVLFFMQKCCTSCTILKFRSVFQLQISKQPFSLFCTGAFDDNICCNGEEGTKTKYGRTRKKSRFEPFLDVGGTSSPLYLRVRKEHPIEKMIRKVLHLPLNQTGTFYLNLCRSYTFSKIVNQTTNPPPHARLKTGFFPNKSERQYI